MGVVQDGLVLWLDARAQRQLIKMGQSDSIWKDLSGNGNDCEVHREVFDYPPILEGGRNLLKNSNELVETDVYLMKQYYLTEDIEEGEIVTISVKGELGEGKERFGLYNSVGDGGAILGFLYPQDRGEDGVYRKTFAWKRYSTNSHIRLYQMPMSVTGVTSTIEWVKLEKGNKATPWTPAPEDLGLEYPDWIQNFYPGLKDMWYENKLHFIDSDSHIRIPEINLNPDNFTIQVDDKIRAFNGDKVMTENGDEWGRNLIRNSEERYKPTNQAYIIIHDGLTEDGNYTISFEYEIEEENEIVDNFLVYIGRSVARADVTNKPIGKTSVTFSISKNDLNKPIYLYIGTNAHASIPNSGWFKNIKLEKGPQATPWTPAPEDITETNIINHNTPFVKNNTIHTLRFYNRALTDEEILQNYHTTHFLLEPKTFTSNDYYNYYDLNRVEINTLATKDLIEILRGDINLEDIDFDRDMKSIPFADVLNRVERNINTLGNKLYKPKGWMQPKLDWTYNQPFSYVDANRLERNLLLLYNYAKANADKIPYCGQIYVGEEVI